MVKCSVSLALILYLNLEKYILYIFSVLSKIYKLFAIVQQSFGVLMLNDWNTSFC